MPEGVLRHLPRMQVGEGEQHAALVANFYRLPTQEHRSRAAAGQLQASLHLGDGLPGVQPAHGDVALFGILEHVELVDRAAEDLIAPEAGQLEEALVDLNVAQVCEPGDDGGRRVCAERPLEPLLRVEPLGFVIDDQHQAVRQAIGLRENQRPYLMNPPAIVSLPRDLDDDLAERLPS